MTGDLDDIISRLQGLLPQGWFPTDLTLAPVLAALLAGTAEPQAFVYAAVAFLRAQSRISTATGGTLDMAAQDFFGLALQRRLNQSDDDFRRVILANVLRPRGTRAALVSVLQDLTGNVPVIVEGQRETDLGGYSLGVMGYNVAGCYGSGIAYSAFVSIARPEPPAGSPAAIGGYGIETMGGYGVGAVAYASPDVVGVTDAEIYQAADSVRPAGTLVWLRLQPPQPAAPSGPLLLTFNPTLLVLQ